MKLGDSMLFEIKRLINIDSNKISEDNLYNVLRNQYNDLILTKENNKIKISQNAKWGLYYNSFAPNIVLEFLNSNKILSIKFCVCRTTRVLCYLIWLVTFVIELLSVINGQNLWLTICIFAGFVLLSSGFIFLGLWLSSLKYIRFIKGIIKENESADDSMIDGR